MGWWCWPARGREAALGGGFAAQPAASCVHWPDIGGVEHDRAAFVASAWPSLRPPRTPPSPPRPHRCRAPTSVVYLLENTSISHHHCRRIDQMALEEPRGGRALESLVRTVQFWGRAGQCYAGYKACQAHALVLQALGWDEARLKDELWARQHTKAAQQLYSLCVDLRGFYLKVNSA